MSDVLITPPSWFKLENYTKSDLLDYERWRAQIGSRVYLAALLASDQLTVFDEKFLDICTTPFFELDFDALYGSSKAVYSLTYGVAKSIVDTLESLSPARLTSCDVRLAEDNQTSFAMHRHITVDLHASKSEILRDFKKYLEDALEENRIQFERKREAGITQSLLQGWHEHQVLAYQDLFLWHQRHQKSMPSETKLSDWLFPLGDFGKDKVRDTREKAKSAFTLVTLRQLSFAA